MLSDDLVETMNLVNEIPQCTSDVIAIVQDLVSRAKQGELQVNEGINFLNLKNYTLLDYLINLIFIILKKVSGKQIENDPAVERLVELRTVLEKMKPVNQRLDYQIQKLLTSANTGSASKDDPLNFKPCADNLLSQYDGEENEESDGSESERTKVSTKSNVYVPPKISAAYYEGDETQQSRQQKLLEHVKRRALSSSVLQELKSEYDMGPEEIKEVTNVDRRRTHKEFKEKIRYEEEYMLRLPLTKRQRHEARRVTTISSLSNLAKFDDISALELTPEAMPSQKRKSSKKFISKKAKGKKKSFKRKRH